MTAQKKKIKSPKSQDVALPGCETIAFNNHPYRQKALILPKPPSSLSLSEPSTLFAAKSSTSCKQIITGLVI